MAEAVTYADLRFAPSRPARPAPDEVGDVELTYENFSPSAQDPRRPPTAAQEAARPCRLALCSAAPLALLGAGLVLLAACVGLGVRYGQVCQELGRATRRQEAESSRLAGTISGQERNLTRAWQQLTRAQADLDATRRALWRSWQAGNDTRQELEQELRAARSNLTLLQREKDGATRQLQEAVSCRQIGCCPPGWKLFRWRCLWVSDEWETWKRSNQSCENKRAQVLILKPWDAATVLDAAGERGLLQATELWIGLAAEWSQRQWSWSWTDGSRYESKDQFQVTTAKNEACATLNRGQLSGSTCVRKWLRYICEKAASPDPLPARSV